MALISQALEPHKQWNFSAITNYRGSDRVAGRKRSRDVDDENENESMCHHESNLRGSSKKFRVKDVLDASSLMSAFDGAFSHPESVKDGVPVQDNNAITATATEALEVAKVIAILLDTLDKKKSQQLLPSPQASPHRRLPTSPLSDSPYRAPFVRKEVGGVCRGRVEPGLQKWLLRKNHMDEWSSEWLESFHEMGWETLHPSWVSHSDDTFTAPDDAFDDWIEVDVDRVASNSRAEIDIPEAQNNVWNSAEAQGQFLVAF
ncbi:hypothetical protein BU17DRAFT_88119 [Hysterangium stoloniferum]|nr:hypothetical protein BU17DRAFT_88119 [Hysterangium stoloniferum]